MKKRLLASLLTLCLLLGLFPTASLAAGDNGDSGGVSAYAGGQTEKETVSADNFTLYKDGMASGQPSEDVNAGELGDDALDLSSENLYFDHAEVNDSRVYEAGTLINGDEEIVYYGSITRALSILGEGETIDLYYVSKYPVTYSVSDGITQTAGDELVEKGGSLTFRAVPSAQDKEVEA